MASSALQSLPGGMAVLSIWSSHDTHTDLAMSHCQSYTVVRHVDSPSPSAPGVRVVENQHSTDIGA